LIHFRLTDNRDPEERLEEAALWKAMHDEYGDEIEAIKADTECNGVAFGREQMFVGVSSNPVSDRLPYWEDDAFLARCNRLFCVTDLEGLDAAVARLHSSGYGAFVKSTRSKHFVCKIPLGETVDSVVGDMAYSFMDGGPRLMVQQLSDMKYEHRFFCIGRKIVTDAPINPRMTPLDFPWRDGQTFERPADVSPVYRPKIVSALRGTAKWIARNMKTEHATIDCAVIDGKPGVVELNPMRLGQIGLYACNVRALAKASRQLTD
jgi:hypothetical protein